MPMQSWVSQTHHAFGFLPMKRCLPFRGKMSYPPMDLSIDKHDLVAEAELANVCLLRWRHQFPRPPASYSDVVPTSGAMPALSTKKLRAELPINRMPTTLASG